MIPIRSSPAILLPYMKKLPLALAIASLALPVLASAVELSLVRGSFENPGVDSDASGTIQSNFTRNNPQLQAHLRGLTAGQTYQFTVDGVSQAEFAAGDNGRAELRFRLKGTPNPLDFDPRGHLLAVNDGTGDVLSMVFSGEDEPATLAVDERTTLLPVDDTVSGRIDARYLKQRNQTRFILHFHGFDSGVYQVYVDGQPQADVTIGRGRSQMVTFSANTRASAKKPTTTGGGKGNSNRPELDFDPRGLVIDVVKDGAVLYSGEMLAQVAGVNSAEPATAETTLTSSGADADATATAELNVRSDASREFSVEVENLPVGDYTLLVGGIERGTISVTDATTGAGEIEFSTKPEDGELLLNFDLSGQSIEIKQGTTSYFTGTVNGTLTPVTDPATSTTTLPLLNQLVDSDASAHITIASDASGPLSLDVSASNLSAGDYDFVVDGVVKGTLTVAADNELATLSFAVTPDVDQAALDFSLSGVSVAISQGATTLLSRLLP